MSGASQLAAPLLHSLLFVPADRPERFAKAVGSGAHGVIFDLEDAVAAHAKAQARAALTAWFAAEPQPVVHSMVRINGVGTAWHEADLQWLATLPSSVAVMLPKSEPASLHAVATCLKSTRHLYALVETVAGVLGLRTMATEPGLQRFAFGNIDFSLDAGIEPDAYSEAELIAVRSAFVLESRYAGLAAPIDGVSLELQDEARMAELAQRSRRMGFAGKLCIHPRQVAAVHTAFAPTPAQIAWARGVLAAFEASAGGVVRYEGKMLDRPVALLAQKLLDSAPHAG